MFFISIGIVLMVIALTTYYFAHRPCEVIGGGVETTENSKSAKQNVRNGEEPRQMMIVSAKDSILESTDSGDESENDIEIGNSESSEHSEQEDLPGVTKEVPIGKSESSKNYKESGVKYEMKFPNSVFSESFGPNENLSGDENEAAISESISVKNSNQEDQPADEANGIRISEPVTPSVLSKVDLLHHSSESTVRNLAFLKDNESAKSTKQILCDTARPEDFNPPVAESILLTRECQKIQNFDSSNVLSSPNPKLPPPIPRKPKSLAPVKKISFENCNAEDMCSDRISTESKLHLDPRARVENLSTNSENDSVPVARISFRNLALNLKINPLALLPGSKPVNVKPNVVQSNSSSEESSSEETKEHHFGSPELLTNISKNRAKIARPRRPPTRRPRSPEAKDVFGISCSLNAMNIDITDNMEVKD